MCARTSAPAAAATQWAPRATTSDRETVIVDTKSMYAAHNRAAREGSAAKVESTISETGRPKAAQKGAIARLQRKRCGSA